MVVIIYNEDHSLEESADNEHSDGDYTSHPEEESFIREVKETTSVNGANRLPGEEINAPCEPLDNTNQEINASADNAEITDADMSVAVVTEDTAPDGGWGWCIVVGALLLRTVIGGLGRSHGLFYIKFKERFDGSATSTALVTSLTGFIRLSTGPIVSILSGRFQCRVLTTIGTGLIFTGLILTMFAPNLQFLYFSYGVVSGLGRSFALTPVPILLGYYFNKRRSLAFGLASAGFSIGGFAITPIVELLFQHYGYQGTFLILSGFVFNILVSSALFRPIELHRKLTAFKRKANSPEQPAANELKSVSILNLEHIESGAVMSSSTIALNVENGSEEPYVQSDKERIETCANTSNKESSVASKTHIPGNIEDSLKHIEVDRKQATDISDAINENFNVNEESEQTDTLLSDKNRNVEHEQAAHSKRFFGKLCCCKKQCDTKCNSERESKKKNKLISWSILKDTRFLCYVFATFCFTLPSSVLFLPSLGKSKGLSDIQAATLLSISAGSDTVFRVISGFVLDLKVFRSIRPQIYNGVTFLEGALIGLFPLMTNFPQFMILCVVEGGMQGIKNAQGTVIMMDMLGVDKLASSLAVTMAVQGVAVVLGPTISGRLIDAKNNYDVAFYFASGAIILGGLVMLAGNIAKHCRDKQSAKRNAKCAQEN